MFDVEEVAGRVLEIMRDAGDVCSVSYVHRRLLETGEYTHYYLVLAVMLYLLGKGVIEQVPVATKKRRRWLFKLKEGA